jgi:hypothetical protein
MREIRAWSLHVDNLRSIDPIDVIEVKHRRHDRAMRHIIASQFFGNEPAGFLSLPIEKTAEKPFSHLLIAMTLHKDINDIAILIDHAPGFLSHCQKFGEGI